MISGAARRSPHGDKWVKTAKNSKAGVERPAERLRQEAAEGSSDLPSEANMIEMSTRTFSSEAVDRARFGRRRYGLSKYLIVGTWSVS